MSDYAIILHLDSARVYAHVVILVLLGVCTEGKKKNRWRWHTSNHPGELLFPGEHGEFHNQEVKMGGINLRADWRQDGIKTKCNFLGYWKALVHVITRVLESTCTCAYVHQQWEIWSLLIKYLKSKVTEMYSEGLVSKCCAATKVVKAALLINQSHKVRQGHNSKGKCVYCKMSLLPY